MFATVVQGRVAVNGRSRPDNFCAGPGVTSSGPHARSSPGPGRPIQLLDTTASRRAPCRRPIPAAGPIPPTRRGMCQMSDGQTPGNAETPSGLRRAMEDRLTSLRQAEERLQREQSALQEQAKVVFAEREARLAPRERELSKREAALAVSEGIASSQTGGGSDAERAHLEEMEADLARRSAELAAREQEIAAREAAPAGSDAAPPAGLDIDAAP